MNLDILMCHVPLTVLIFLPTCRNTLGHHAVHIANIGDQLTTCSCWLSTLHDVASLPNTLKCFIGSIMTQPCVNNEKLNHLCKKIREGASTSSRLPCGESRTRQSIYNHHGAQLANCLTYKTVFVLFSILTPAWSDPSAAVADHATPATMDVRYLVCTWNLKLHTQTILAVSSQRWFCSNSIQILKLIEFIYFFLSICIAQSPAWASPKPSVEQPSDAKANPLGPGHSQVPCRSVQFSLCWPGQAQYNMYNVELRNYYYNLVTTGIYLTIFMYLCNIYIHK